MDQQLREMVAAEVAKAVASVMASLRSPMWLRANAAEIQNLAEQNQPWEHVGTVRPSTLREMPMVPFWPYLSTRRNAQGQTELVFCVRSGARLAVRGALELCSPPAGDVFERVVTQSDHMLAAYISFDYESSQWDQAPTQIGWAPLSALLGVAGKRIFIFGVLMWESNKPPRVVVWEPGVAVAYVPTQALPQPCGGSPTPGQSYEYARADHVHYCSGGASEEQVVQYVTNNMSDILPAILQALNSQLGAVVYPTHVLGRDSSGTIGWVEVYQCPS